MESSRKERKIVTVLFADLVGFTARAEELDPEDVEAILEPYHARLRAELERHGGTVEKFIGDAVMAIFGAPVAHEDDPERAVRAAIAIHDAVAKLNAEDEWLDLHIRTAVHTGEALVVALCEHAESAGAVHWGRCLPYGEGITYWPVIEILKDAAGILRSDEPE